MIDEQFRRTLNIEYKKFNNIQANSTNKITEQDNYLNLSYIVLGFE